MYVQYGYTPRSVGPSGRTQFFFGGNLIEMASSSTPTAQPPDVIVQDALCYAANIGAMMRSPVKNPTTGCYCSIIRIRGCIQLSWLFFCIALFFSFLSALSLQFQCGSILSPFHSSSTCFVWTHSRLISTHQCHDKCSRQWLSVPIQSTPAVSRLSLSLYIYICTSHHVLRYSHTRI